MAIPINEPIDLDIENCSYLLVDAEHVPIIDDEDNFKSDTVEGALKELKDAIDNNSSSSMNPIITGVSANNLLTVAPDGSVVDSKICCTDIVTEAKVTEVVEETVEAKAVEVVLPVVEEKVEATVEQKVQEILPELELSGDKEYVYTQSTAVDTWEIEHSLNKMPSVTVVDSANNVVCGDIQYLNPNKIRIKFSGAFSGKAYLN